MLESGFLILPKSTCPLFEGGIPAFNIGFAMEIKAFSNHYFVKSVSNNGLRALIIDHWLLIIGDFGQ